MDLEKVTAYRQRVNIPSSSKVLAEALLITLEALEKYANSISYIHDADHRSEIDRDAGRLAKDALTKIALLDIC